jgi:hypothetical protein
VSSRVASGWRRSFLDPRTQQRASAHPWELAGDTGAFSFFGADNTELVVKVLDGRAVNGRFWVFYGALSDVAYDLTVTDTLSGEQRVYHNAAARWRARPIPGPSRSLRRPRRLLRHRARPRRPRPVWASRRMTWSRRRAPTMRRRCCLGSGRFSLEVDWHAVGSGARGAGQAIPLSTESGYFWFFGPGNVELVVKVLDGEPVNGHVWVFYASLTDVEFALTVIDNATSPPTRGPITMRGEPRQRRRRHRLLTSIRAAGNGHLRREGVIRGEGVVIVGGHVPERILALSIALRQGGITDDLRLSGREARHGRDQEGLPDVAIPGA